MAYDAATGTVVLFGGANSTFRHTFGDTWTWDGTTWTKQSPATSPPARRDAAMAYDPATGTVVLFGGGKPGHLFGGTWTWDGTTWTKQHPATSPPARAESAMAYDAATHTVVLFGGVGSQGGAGVALGDTWTWDGTTWTKQSPATSPPAAVASSMAYDPATGTAVLFGGFAFNGPLFAGTWTWDGTSWTKQSPATHPPARYGASMAYDAATGTVVMFGGSNSHERAFGGTWVWDGTTWTRQSPATHPHARIFAAMAYDAATRTVVMFGGFYKKDFTTHGLGDTWTWGSG